MGFKTFIWSFFMLFTFAGIAQEVKFEASVQNDRAGRIRVSFEVNADGNNFRGPDLKNFRVLAGPSQQTSYSVVNGHSTRSTKFTFILAATKAGKFTIAPATINVNGKTYKSNPLTITVSGNNNNQQNANQQNTKQQEPKDLDLSKDLYLKLYVDKNSMYQGEAVVAYYKIFTRVDVSDYDIKEMPSFAGFWSQDVEEKTQNQLVRENINGVVFNTATMKKAVLFPQQSGKLKLDRMALDLKVKVREQSNGRGSLFDQFFGRHKLVDFSAASNSATIDVKPLPAGKPADFNGGVGQFKISSKIDKALVTTNEAINLKVVLSGKGNLKLIEDPKINFPPDFEVYDPKITDKITTNASGSSGKRIFEYVIIPRHSGDFTIPAIGMSYFNPKTEKYESSAGKELSIHVDKGDETESTTSYIPVDKSDVKVLGKDIRFIKEGEAELTEKDTPGTPMMLWIVLALPLIITPVVYGAKNKYSSYMNDTAGLSRKKANKMALKRLSAAKAHLDSKEDEKAYQAIYQALYGYLEDKLSIPSSETNKENLKQQLTTNGASAPTVELLIASLDDCEMARFAPSSVKPANQVYENAASAITKLQEELA